LTVRFTPTARTQLLSALAYIADDDPEAAKRFRRRSETKLRRLERFPQSGKPILEFPDLPHREIVVAPYRFFYRVQGRVVWVVGVWHGAQMPRPVP
jgi:plasmid stabilization system protein ParE